MAATPAFPYETRLNVLHNPLELIDEKALAARASSSGTTKLCAR